MMSVVSGFLTTVALAKVVSRIILICTALFVQSQPALRIVVIEGEDAVNVIQQKTAVAPVIEVRDRNNLPVPGHAKDRGSLHFQRPGRATSSFI
jgi:hypothetical protein